MYCPLVGERVRVNGCAGDFLVVRVDYTACVAAIVAASYEGLRREDVPFYLLGARCQGESPKIVSGAGMIGFLRASWQCIFDTNTRIADTRATIRATVDTIRRSEAMIAESDRFIARAQTLGC